MTALRDYTEDYTEPSAATDYTEATRPSRETLPLGVTDYTEDYTDYTRHGLHESPPLYKGGMSPQAPENGATSTTITSGVDS